MDYRTKVKEPVLHYLPIAGGRTDDFLSFPRALAQAKTQTDSSRIWTRMDNSIPYDDNRYTNAPPNLKPFL